MDALIAEIAAARTGGPTSTPRSEPVARCPRPEPCAGLPVAQGALGSVYCTCPDGAEARERFERNLALGWPGAAVPERLAACTMASARAIHVDGTPEKPASGASRDAFDAADRLVRAFAEGRRPGAGLALFGPVGTGKSGLLAAVTHAVRSFGVPVLWTTYADLFGAVQAHYGTEQSGSRLLNAQRAPVLVLDELGDPFRVRGEEQETEDRRGIVYAVVAARVAAFRPTLVSANYAGLRALADQFDERVADRLKEGCELHTLPGESLRRRPRI